MSAASPSAAAPPREHDDPGTPAGVVLSDAAVREAGIRVEPAVFHNLATEIVATGRVVPNQDRTFQVGSMVGGRVSEVNVSLGDRVEAGQVLLRMHSHDIHDTRAAYLMARDVVHQAEARSALAEKIRDRARRLLALEAISKEQAEQAETDWKNAVADVDSARARLESERTHLTEVLEVPIDASGMPEDVDTLPVRAPASGILIERKATPGVVVNPGDVLLTITDPSNLWVIAAINEADLADLRAGQTASISVRAWPDRTFGGRILKLGEMLDPVTRTLQVRICVPNPDGRLKPEMFADVKLASSQSSRAIVVPRDAVQDLNGKPIVFVENAPRHFAPRSVATSDAGVAGAQIVSGIHPGERIAISGAFVLKSELLKSELAED